ncbi:MAG: phosphoglycolate phosphatase [Euryarchaeota archaeon]|mgnify:CR=1 FL=1|uniref:phosphoglycolate phosphatase n=1 Tax=Methanobacterium sp. MZD130B TaxID=3394378 RepID=UPI0017798001|nr:phosphoglycolate phosphatase [Euryarchaeota archaeon]HHT19545.1 phosphoglycolate phosphatase [Methanobacterium sp.]
MIKAIALDVDGTITDKKRRLCSNAVEAIQNVESMGIPVIIVTGNIFAFSKFLSMLLGTTGGLVVENGGVIQCNHDKIVLGDIKKCKKAYKHLKTIYPVKKVEYSMERLSEIALYRTVSTKLIKEALKDFDVEIYDSGFAVHLTDPEVNKGSSLIKLLRTKGIHSKEVLAVGDSENDLDFLKMVGVKVAVSNANPELKAIADYVTEKPFGNGVKEALERFVL